MKIYRKLLLNRQKLKKYIKNEGGKRKNEKKKTK